MITSNHPMSMLAVEVVIATTRATVSDQRVATASTSQCWSGGNDLLSDKTKHYLILSPMTLQWLHNHNERDDVSRHRRLNCLLNCLFRRRSKKTSKLCITGRCDENPSVMYLIPLIRASHADNVLMEVQWYLPENNFPRRASIFRNQNIFEYHTY